MAKTNDEPTQSRPQLIEAYRRPYHPPCDAYAILDALSYYGVNKPWPVRDQSRSQWIKEAA